MKETDYEYMYMVNALTTVDATGINALSMKVE
jgi:hypothetical protein